MSQSNIRYTANPNIDFSSPPDGNRLVTWLTESGEFSFHRIAQGGLPVKFAAKADDEGIEDKNEYQLYSAYTNASNNTVTTDFNAVTHVGINSILDLDPDNIGIDFEDYLTSFTSGSLEIIPETQQSTFTGGRYEITDVEVFGDTEVVYTVNILYAFTQANSAPSLNQNATLLLKGTAGGGGGGDGSVIVGSTNPVVGTQNSVFSKSINGSTVILSGSDAFQFLQLNDVSGDGGVSSEFKYRVDGNVDFARSVAIEGPLRLQTYQIEGFNNNPLPYDPRVGFSYEFIETVRPGNVSVGPQPAFVTFEIPKYIGSGSYEYDDNKSLNLCISGSCNALKVEHVATDSTNTRTQYCTHYFAWNRNSSANAQNLFCSSVEHVRVPSNELIIDPSRTTGSWDADGNLELNIYHYNVDNTQHNFRVTTL